MAINRKVYVIGGGTISDVRNHLGLVARGKGTAARKIAALCKNQPQKMDIELCLTGLADPTSKIDTVDDVEALVLDIIKDRTTKIVFFTTSIVDFAGQIGDVPSGKYAERLHSRDEVLPVIGLTLNKKLLSYFRMENPLGISRKDITLVGFKTTCGATEHEQYLAALNLLKSSSANLVLANDTKTRVNMIVVPEEAYYCVTTDRDKVFAELVEMAYLRSNLTFTRSTVVDGKPVPWDSEEVPSSLRTVVDHCIGRGAYKRFRGVTAGHFAVKLSEDTFLTSRRKTDFNDLPKVGLVRVKTDGPDSVIAYGAKPSVGGQSQRIVFSEHPEYDCIVHFHCPIRSESSVPIVSQREFECGSHECGANTSRGLKPFGEGLNSFSAVHLDNHGPNIAFNRAIDPQKVINFIEANFDLEGKTGGYVI